MNSEQLCKLLQEDPRIDLDLDSTLTPMWIHQCIKQHKTNLKQMERAIKWIRANHEIKNPCAILMMRDAFVEVDGHYIANAARLKRRITIENEDRGNTTNSTHHVTGFKIAQNWFSSYLNDEIRREIMQKIVKRLQYLNYDEMIENPFDYGLGQALLVHWYKFYNDQGFQQMCLK